MTTEPRHSPDFAALLAAFEQGTLPPAQLTHRMHLALGWHYLQRDGFPAGATAFREHLLRYVEAVGATGKFHETITWAYLVLMNEERMLRAEPGEGFDAMIARRPDLLDHRGGALSRCYTAEELDSPEARTTFILPRRTASS